MTNRLSAKVAEQLAEELDNFQDIARYLLPQPDDVPRLPGIDVWGGTRPLSGAIGGDHVIFVDFKQLFDLEARTTIALQEGRHDIVENLMRCRRMAGVALIDVSGHRVTDAFMAAMLHQAFLVGALYELDMFGQITHRLFENLNTRFYQSSGAHKFISLMYGEISEDARFRFLSAGQPVPVVFSRVHDRFMDIAPGRFVSFPPLGMQPSRDAIDRNTATISQTATTSALGFKDQYEMNEWWLMGAGDILLLHTDGLTEHARGDEPYFPSRLQRVVRELKSLGARDIYDGIMRDVEGFAEPTDDVSLMVIKLA